MYELRANHIRRAFFRGCSTRGAHIRMPNYKRTCLPRGSRRLLDDWRLSFCAPSSRLSTFLAYSDFGYKVNFATMREKESRANNRGGSSARERKRSAKVHRLSNNKALHTLGALRCCFFLPRFAPIHRRLASARMYTGKLESEPSPSLSLSLSRARALSFFLFLNVSLPRSSIFPPDPALSCASRILILRAIKNIATLTFVQCWGISAEIFLPDQSTCALCKGKTLFSKILGFSSLSQTCKCIEV